MCLKNQPGVCLAPGPTPGYSGSASPFLPSSVAQGSFGSSAVREVRGGQGTWPGFLALPHFAVAWRLPGAGWHPIWTQDALRRSRSEYLSSYLTPEPTHDKQRRDTWGLSMGRLGGWVRTDGPYRAAKPKSWTLPKRKENSWEKAGTGISQANCDRNRAKRERILGPPERQRRLEHLQNWLWTLPTIRKLTALRGFLRRCNGCPATLARIRELLLFLFLAASLPTPGI